MISNLSALQVLDRLPESLIVTDPSGNILYVNEAFSKVTGYTGAEAIGQNPRILKSERHDAEFYRRIWQNIEKTGFWQGEIWNRRKNGEIYLENLSISVVKDAEGHPTHYLGVFNDITEKKITEDRLKFLAYYDILTGIPNRTLAINRLAKTLSRARRHKKMAAVLFMDLDMFKKVNDSMGHNMGDNLLKAVAERLKICVREEDTVSRIGGDEFAVILADISNRDDAAKIARKILDSVGSPVTVSGVKLFITPSIGISFFPADAEDAEGLIKCADRAMYNAKDHGRNNYQFYIDYQRS